VAPDDDAVGDVEPEARPRADPLGRVERLEGARLKLLGDAGARIGDLHQHTVTFTRGPKPYASRCILVGFARHRVYGVVYEVRPDLIELAPVGADAGQTLVIVALDLDAS
jgi:hypothetical protein